MFIKKFASIAALSLTAIASISYAGSAHALGFSYSAGAYRDSAVTNEGAFAKGVFDAGALSVGNTLQFLKGGNLVKELTFDMMNALAPVSASQHGGQNNGVFEFFSEGMDDNFDKIVISQTTGGGFESDNHTFRTGTGKYSAKVPEPSVALGLLAVGGVFLRKRKNQKSLNLG